MTSMKEFKFWVPRAMHAQSRTSAENDDVRDGEVVAPKRRTAIAVATRTHRRGGATVTKPPVGSPP